MNSSEQKKRALSGAERQAKYIKNNKQKADLSEAKRQFERSVTLASDSEKATKMREAAKLRKQAQRSREKLAKANENDENKDPENKDNSEHENECSYQRILGAKKKRKNMREKNKTIEELREENKMMKEALDKNDDQLAELDFKLKETEIDNNKLREKIKNLEDGKEKEAFENDDWIRKVYDNLSSQGRSEFRNAFSVAAPSLKRGTLSRLRKTTGINFSINTTNTTGVESELKNKIVEFALENTIDVPDKKKYVKGARFRTASLLTLYNNFESQNPGQCTYATFTKYWPALFVKPLASEFGTCLCTICQNMELKVEALKGRKLIFQAEENLTLDIVIKAAREEDFEPENRFKSEVEALADEDKANVDVGYLEWNKVKQTEINRNTGKTKGDKTMRLSKHLPAAELGKIVLEEFDNYKNHLDRDFVMKKELKKVRLDAMEDNEIAVLHIDWAEQHKITEVKEIQSAYFNGRYSYDIHTGYVYTKEDSHGFASISDSSDHKAEAIHNAIKPKIEELVVKGKKKIIICSDSPTSQYRNSKNVFLMKKLCQEFNISIRLLFTESGHGKSPCDGVGGNIKTQVEAALLNIHGNNEIKSIHSAQDVAELIATKTELTYDIKVHAQEVTDDIRKNLPKLSPLVGALKTHEIMITADGVIKKKELPSDSFYKAVVIRESRKMNRTRIEQAIEIMENNSNIDSPNDNLDTAFTEDDNTRQKRTKRIKTAAEIEAELNDSFSDDDDYSSDSDWN